MSIDLEVLRRVELFEGLDPLGLAHIASIAERHEYPKGEVLFEEGDDGAHIFIVVEGSIRISKIVSGIGEEALAVLRPGAYFGEMEFIERDLDRAARAIVHEKAVLYALAYTELDDVLGSDASLALAIQHAMLKTLGRRLRATNDKVTAMFAMAQFG
jgi:CRP-like cAMP-binding protein